MKASILCIGDEVLCGDVLNSNGTFFAKELTEIGIEVVKHVVVSDDFEMVESAFKDAVEISDIIITTGGLGPTEDDMTKEAIAEVTGRKLVEIPEAREHVETYFKQKLKGYRIAPNNYRQAVFPEGAQIIINESGTAPGAYLHLEGGKTVIMVPGPPRENTNMYNRHVKEYLQKRLNKFFTSKDYMTSGMGESDLEYELRKILPEDSPVSVNTYFNDSGVKIKAVSKADNLEKSREELEKIDRIITDHFRDYIYSTEGETLPERMVAMMSEKKMTFSCAESCTGGLLASFITQVPGASEMFSGGAVTYTNDMKHKLLGVRKETLKKHGAVSSSCVEEMAKGCAELFESDAAVSISGIAGPGGGTDEKPVGTVFMGFYLNGEVTSEEFHITGDRRRIQHRSVYYALQNIYKIITAAVD